MNKLFTVQSRDIRNMISISRETARQLARNANAVMFEYRVDNWQLSLEYLNSDQPTQLFFDGFKDGQEVCHQLLFVGGKLTQL